MDKLTLYLDKFQYSYKQEGNNITVFIDKKFKVTVRKVGDGYSISNSTLGWSPLSGFFNMSLEKLLVFNAVGFFICFVVFELLKFSNYQYDYSYIIYFCLAIYFLVYFYYLIKYEFLKLKIEKILNN